MCDSPDLFDSVYPEKLREAEAQTVQRRREQARFEASSAENAPVGLALSGGGIRSATFALGMLQAIAAARLLRCIDYLSTVSGGGYIGSFLGRLFLRARPAERQEFEQGLTATLRRAGDTPPEWRSVDLAEAVLTDSFSPPIEWLRENGRYLSPNGSGDTLIGVAVMIRNWIAARVVLWALILAVFVGLNTLRATAATATFLPETIRTLAWGKVAGLGGWTLWWSPAFVLTGFLVLLWVVPLIWAYWLFPVISHRGTAGFFMQTHIVIVILALAAPRITVPTEAPEFPWRFLVMLAGLVLFLAVTFVVVAAIKRRGSRGRGGRATARQHGGFREALEFVVGLLALLIAAALVAYGMLPEPLRIEVAPWIFPWTGNVLEPQYSTQGLASAFLGLVILVLVFRLVAGGSARDVATFKSGKGITVSCVVLIAAFYAGYFLIPTAPDWMPNLDDVLCTIAVVALLRGAFPVLRLSSGKSKGRNTEPQNSRPFDLALHLALTLAILILSTLTWSWSGDVSVLSSKFYLFCFVIGVTGSLALGYAWIATYRAHRLAEEGTENGASAELWGRNRLSAWLKNGLVVVGLFSVYTLIDSCGQGLYALYQSAEARAPGSGFKAAAYTFGVVIAAILSVVAASQKLSANLTRRDQGKRIKLRWEFVSLLIVVPLVAAELISLNAISHAATWGGAVPTGDPGLQIGEGIIETVIDADALPVMQAGAMSLPVLFPASLVLLLIAWSMGRCWAFVNRSTFNPLYAARLTRAYLGASNPRRWGGPDEAVTQVVPGDATDFGDYAPHDVGGPLHLINITINETASGRSQIEQRDRKGLSLAIGPLGVSVHRQHHALWKLKETRADGLQPPDLRLQPISPPAGTFRVFETPDGEEEIRCAEIPLALAMAISGAAFTTGLGARTSLGVSLLCGLFNIRLGYWWDSGVHPGDRKNRSRPGALGWFEWQLSRWFPVQGTLLQEFTARFHGPARRQWYLSDGGHYENMGAYELVRRRIPWIIVSDAEADPDYSFSGLSKLVRTVRIDFGAEIEFLTEGELDVLLDEAVRSQFGTPEQLRRGRWSDEAADDPNVRAPKRKRTTIQGARGRLSLAHASLAWVRYPTADGQLDPCPGSLMIYVKPTLIGDEPQDVRQYHAEHPDFPQEATADQYFDEAQWESYRELGEHIGRRVIPDQVREWLAPSTPANRTSPRQLHESLELINSLALYRTPSPRAETAPAGGSSAREIRNRFGGFLVLDNVSSQPIEFCMTEEQFARFQNGGIILTGSGSTWRDLRSSPATVEHTIPVPAHSSVVIQE